MADYAELKATSDAAKNLKQAIEHNTAALLTIAAEVLAFSVARSGGEPLTPQEIKEEVLKLFNGFLPP